jgi:hypothetical protein
LCEFVDDTAINLARPVKPKMESDGAVPNRANAIFVDVNEAEIGGYTRGKSQGLSSANVVRDAFKAFEKLKAKEAQNADQNNNRQGDQAGDKFERLRLHDGR